MPQYHFRFKDDTPTSKIVFSTAKEFFSLLSFFALDFNWDIDLDQLESRYNESNLVDIFHPLNQFEVNNFGYCKHQGSKQTLQDYCIDNSNGLNIMSVLIRDLGFQFGVLSKSNVKITSDSFWIIYQTLITSLNRFLKDEKRGNTLLKMMAPHDPEETEQWKFNLWLLQVYTNINVLLKWTVVFNCILASLCLMLLSFWIYLQIESTRTLDNARNLKQELKSISKLEWWLSLINVIVTILYLVCVSMLVFLINSLRYRRIQMLSASLGTGVHFLVTRLILEMIFSALCRKWMVMNCSSVLKENPDIENNARKEEGDGSGCNLGSGSTAVNGCIS